MKGLDLAASLLSSEMWFSHDHTRWLVFVLTVASLGTGILTVSLEDKKRGQARWTSGILGRYHDQNILEEPLLCSRALKNCLDLEDGSGRWDIAWQMSVKHVGFVRISPASYVLHNYSCSCKC